MHSFIHSFNQVFFLFLFKRSIEKYEEKKKEEGTIDLFLLLSLLLFHKEKRTTSVI
jgi:hypothetical protein